MFCCERLICVTNCDQQKQKEAKGLPQTGFDDDEVNECDEQLQMKVDIKARWDEICQAIDENNVDLRLI